MIDVIHKDDQSKNYKKDSQILFDRLKVTNMSVLCKLRHREKLLEIVRNFICKERLRILYEVLIIFILSYSLKKN